MQVPVANGARAWTCTTEVVRAASMDGRIRMRKDAIVDGGAHKQGQLGTSCKATDAYGTARAEQQHGRIIR